jgi:dTMP kinase
MKHPHRKGRLVVIEGIDGAGKSTVVRRLADYCLSQGLPHLVSREPTTGQWGKRLRDSALTGRLDLAQELELFTLDRTEHVQSVIEPALAEGKIVILDRYYFSTAAYQGARGADPEAILQANEKFAPEPDLVLLLDLDPLAGRARITGRGDLPDSFEGAEALAAVRKIFLSIQRPFLVRCDASGQPEQVTQEALTHLQALIQAMPPRP